MSTIYFGKYKNRTIDDLIRSDPKYVLWLSKQPWVKDDIINAIKVGHGKIVLSFGRYEGLCLDSIKQSDQSYYEWLLRDSRIV